ncbi:uncharacterized protein PITG_09329 [Phytophthora infestans T30-4]|uniref:Peptidase S74 domain-containing protein n=1 Tax=Phytophthora infestans (strain T30-4) TaxID=403677 RepID=D0NBF5_PHYIT|nr:uncharacterized protein PITG_09329 [Phytophthora infestans T30-4]EEY55384.1 conserved hypothetical protein [Phytophthora infestans T30-4]|eukprot:XP_002903608.1 conserved hypothetical protein [Phytophthora infestans T30-4]
MGYLSGVIAGSASYSKTLILDSSGNISGINSFGASTITGALQTGSQPNITSLGSLSGLTIGGNLSFSGSSRSISITGTSSYIDCREYRQNGTIYDLGLLEYINGVSFGTATPNKFLLCDSSSNIGGLSSVTATTLTCTNLRQGSTYYDLSSFLTSIPTSLSLNNLSASGDISCSGVINGVLAYGNQSAITTVGSLTEFGINSTATNEYFSITGSGLDFLDGSYTRMMTLTGSNTTPVQFQIEVHNGNRSTTANASWIGNITNNDLRFGVNNSTSMILTTTGRVGLGTTSPSAPLHVPGSNSFVFGAGRTTVYRLRADSGATESALGPITYLVAGIFGGYIACTAMAMTSHRRLKKNIQSCPIDRVKRLYDSCEVKLYDWIESENKPGQEIGLIAQALVSAHLTDLISIFYRDDIEEGEDPSLEPAKQQLNVDYSRISAYNMKMIQHLLGEIDRLKDRLANIES